MVLRKMHQGTRPTKNDSTSKPYSATDGDA